MDLWNTDTEKQFFTENLAHFATPEKLFYNIKSGKFAYIPKNCDSEGQALQSRNTLIGSFTETWAKNLFLPIAQKHGLFAVNSVECPEIGLMQKSEADLAFCTTDSKFQQAKNVKLIFEIKMSIVSNYEYTKKKTIEFIGDYKTHQGNPSLLRSYSMLKTIGKAINIRVSGIESSNIPITNNYTHKVDFLKTAGVIQGFWSLNPDPVQSDFIRETNELGFQTIKNIKSLENLVKNLLSTKLNYFSSMVPQSKLGEYIRIASQESTDEAKAEKFLFLIRGK